MRPGTFLLLLAFAAGFAATAPAQVVTSNLLTNPGAEAGFLSGWTVQVGNAFVDNGTFDPGINPRTGSFDFSGGPANPLGQVYQTVDLVGSGQVTALQLDSGTVTADVTFWEQGLNQGSPSDNAAVKITFLDVSGAPLGNFTSATVDSHTGTWTSGGLSSIAVPIGARYVTYSMLFQRNVGSDNDSFIDDNSLTLTIPVPEPGTWALLAGGLPVIGLAIWGGRTRPRARVR